MQSPKNKRIGYENHEEDLKHIIHIKEIKKDCLFLFFFPHFHFLHKF